MSARKFYIMQSAVEPMQSELPCYTPLTNQATDVHTVPLVMSSDYAALEAECDALRQQRDKLAELLREANSAYTTAIHWEDMRAAMAQIDTALSELTP